MNDVVTAAWTSLAAVLVMTAIIAIVLVPVFLGVGPLFFGVYSFLLVWIVIFVAILGDME